MLNTYWIVLITYLVIVFGLGIWAAKQNTTTEAFYLGGRSLGPLVIAAAWGATLVSAATFLGVTGFGYQNGWAGVIWGGVAMTFGGLAAWVVLGKRVRLVSQKINAITMPGILFARYRNKSINMIVAAMLFLFYIPLLVVQIASAGILFETIFGVPYFWGIIIFGVIVVVYTAIGGFLAIAYSDVLQLLVMVGCFLVATPVILNNVGGVSNLHTTMASIDPGLVSIHGANNAFPTMLIISWVFYYVFALFGQPYMSIRFMAAKNLKTLKLALPIAMVIITWMYINISLFGLSARVLLPDLGAADQAMPELIRTQLSPLLGGLMVSALFAAMMSTVDSVLHVVGTAIAKDFYGNIKSDVTDKQMLNISRFATLLAGVLGLIAAMRPPASVLVLTTYAWTCLGAALFMPIVAGMYWKRFNWQGAMASVLGGGISGAVIIGVFGGMAIGVHPMFIALPIAVVCGIVVTLLTPPPPSDVIDDFFDPETLNAREVPGQ